MITVFKIVCRSFSKTTEKHPFYTKTIVRFSTLFAALDCMDELRTYLTVNGLYVSTPEGTTSVEVTGGTIPLEIYSIEKETVYESVEEAEDEINKI